MAANLADLRTRLDTHVNRSDAPYTTNRDFFLNSGLRWIQRALLTDVGTPSVWTNTGDLIAGVSAVLLPTDYRPSGRTRLYRQSGTTWGEIRRIPLEYLEQPFYDQAARATVDLKDLTVRGVPSYFAVRGRVLEIRPPANAATTLRLHGLGWLLPLAQPTDTNLLTIEAEDLVLYAGCYATWLFFEDLGRAEFWRDQAKDAALHWAGDRVHLESNDQSLTLGTPG